MGGWGIREAGCVLLRWRSWSGGERFIFDVRAEGDEHGRGEAVECEAGARAADPPARRVSDAGGCGQPVERNERVDRGEAECVGQDGRVRGDELRHGGEEEQT